MIFSLSFLVSLLIYVITMPFDCSFCLFVSLRHFCILIKKLIFAHEINSRQLTNETHLTTGNCKIIDWLINEVGIM